LRGIDAEIIVVDNNSTDYSCEMMKTFSSIKLIENKENVGFSKGNNWCCSGKRRLCLYSKSGYSCCRGYIYKSFGFQRRTKLGIVGVKLMTALVISFLKVNGEFNTFVAFTKMAGLYKIFPNQN
jgi:hypothetical protein